MLRAKTIFILAFCFCTLALFCCNNSQSTKSWAMEHGSKIVHKFDKLTRLTSDRFSTPTDLPDHGIWPEQKDPLTLSIPSWVDKKDVSIVVDKAHRVLTIMAEDVPVKSYKIGLGFSVDGHKQVRGDGKTPEGKYYLCENIKHPSAKKYGARSLRLSYPSTADAKQGLEKGVITKAEYHAIEKANLNKQMPRQNTKLGGSIRIHGGGNASDWTLGCIGMRDEDIVELFDYVQDKTPVWVLGKNEKPPYRDMDNDGIPDQIDVLLGAKKAAINGATYNGRYVRIAPKGGDVPKEIGVCTDVVVRSCRNAGLDLQDSVQNDRRKNPKAYPRIQKPDPSIDHRRVRNLVAWFERNWESLPVDDPMDFRPGDVIMMDFHMYEGPDHCGIISDAVGLSGLPLVINNFTVGHNTSEMDMLAFAAVLKRFRAPL